MVCYRISCIHFIYFVVIFVFSQADLSNGNIKQVVYINSLGILGKKSLSVDFYLDVLVKFFI